MLQIHFRKAMLTSVLIPALLQPAFGMWNGTEGDSESQASSPRSASPAPAEATATSESARGIEACVEAYLKAVLITGPLPAQKDPHLGTLIHTLLQTYASEHSVSWENFVTAMNLASPELSNLFQQAIAGVMGALSGMLTSTSALSDESLQGAAAQIAEILQRTFQNADVAPLFQPAVSPPAAVKAAAPKKAAKPKAEAAEPKQWSPSLASIQRPSLSTEEQALLDNLRGAVNGFLNPQIDPGLATKLLVKALIESALKKALLASNLIAGLILKAIDTTQKGLSDQLIAYIDKQRKELERLMRIARLDPQALLTLINEMTQHIAELISAHPEVLKNNDDEEVVVPVAEAASAASAPPAMLAPAPVIKRVSPVTLTLLKEKIAKLKQQDPTHSLYGHALIKALIKAAHEKSLIQSEHTDEKIFNQLSSNAIKALLSIVHSNIATWPDLLVAPSAHVGLLEQSVNQLLLLIAPEINAALTEESTERMCSARCSTNEDGRHDAAS